jgi:hypothetical protein
MNQTDKLASASFLIKRAEEAALAYSSSPEAELNLLQTLQQVGGGIAGGIAGGLAGGKAGLKFLPRLLKKLDLKFLKMDGKSPFAARNIFRDYKKDYGQNLLNDVGRGFGALAGAEAGALGGYFGTGKLLAPSTQKLKENFQQLDTATNELKEKIPNIENIKRLIKENPALAGGAGVAGLAALLGGGYLASKAFSGKKEKEEEEQEE